MLENWELLLIVFKINKFYSCFVFSLNQSLKGDGNTFCCSLVFNDRDFEGRFGLNLGLF